MSEALWHREQSVNNLLSTCYVLGTVLGTEDTAVNKTAEVTTLMEPRTPQ